MSGSQPPPPPPKPPKPPPLPPPPPLGQTEFVREELESAFTPILRKLRGTSPRILSAAFVDDEGECIDYASSIDPFDAKVAAAHMTMLVRAAIESHQKVGVGDPYLLEIVGETRELWARRAGAEYMIVVVLRPGVNAERLREALTEAAASFRTEVGLSAEPWEPHGGVEVVVRSAVGWDYAPVSYAEDGVRVVITDVLGRWDEPGPAGEDTVCFRVRTEDGHEITLVHHPSADGWGVRA